MNNVCFEFDWPKTGRRSSTLADLAASVNQTVEALLRSEVAQAKAPLLSKQVKVVFLPSGKVATMKRGIEILKAAEESQRWAKFKKQKREKEHRSRSGWQSEQPNEKQQLREFFRTLGLDMPNGQFSWAQAAKAWKSQPVDWRPASEILSTDAEPDEPLTTEAWDISTSSEPLGLQAVLDYVAPYWEVVYEGNESAAEHAEELYFTYLYNVTAESREAAVLQACWHGLATGANSEQPLLCDTASKAFLSVTLPRITELCDPRFEGDYSAVLVTYHDNGLFANILQLLDALLLAKPGAPVLVDWQRKGGEGHFQYGRIGFDLFEHLFSRTQRCRSWGKYSADRRLQSSSYNMNKRVSILFMNMLRGLIWSVPPKDFQALRVGYHRAMQGALTISPLISRRVREVTETWPERARVVGVHKRLGTNEVAACQLAQRNPPPEEYLEAAKALLQQTPPGVQQVLYLATDEVQTVEVFRKALPPGSQIQLCCRDGVKRSRGGVRPDGIDNEVHRSPCEAVDAEDALVDAMCLSKCTDLVCIDSNLSIFVSMLNPRIHIHAMSDAVPPGWEERANYPREPVYSSYRVAWNPGLFLSDRRTRKLMMKEARKIMELAILAPHLEPFAAMSVAQTVPRGVPNASRHPVLFKLAKIIGGSSLRQVRTQVSEALSHRTLSTKFLVLAGLLCVAPAFTSLSRPSRGPSVSQRASKVVISGAGPAGLLAARCILDRRPEANLEILEKRGDPRTEQISGFRAYSLGLNIRGRTALQHWEGLWERVSSKGVLSDKFLLHIGGQQLQLRANRPGSVPTLLIARNDLCAALLDDLEKHHGASASGRLSIHFGETLDMIDLKQHTCKTSQGREIGYDDLIGADGVNSLVRSALSTASAFRSESVDLRGQFKVWVGPCPKSMDPMAVHAMSSREYTLFSIPRVDGRLCTILSWTGEAPDFLENSDELIRQRIGADFPSFGPPELSAVEQLQAQRPSKATTIRANRYHDKDGHAMLLGDAAHSTGGTLGQGANSALADVVFLDQLLRKHDAGASVVKDIGEEFSAARQPEGLALWKLLQLPPKGPASVLYLASQGVAGLLSRLLDWLPVGQPPVQNLLSETTTPYSEIVSRNGFWIDMALQDAPGAEISSFESAFPSTAAEIVGQVLFDQIVRATGRYWEGWVELENGGWVRAQGGRSGCWAMEYVENQMVSMRRVSRGELLVPEGERLPRRRRPDEPLPSACCRAETSAYTACTWACISLRAGPRYRRKPQI
ncbi:kmo [Symbiodinium microadriaticum]|nr:kmo [Symbiodinium microadriaticum]